MIRCDQLQRKCSECESVRSPPFVRRIQLVFPRTALHFSNPHNGFSVQYSAQLSIGRWLITLGLFPRTSSLPFVSPKISRIGSRKTESETVSHHSTVTNSQVDTCGKPSNWTRMKCVRHKSRQPPASAPSSPQSARLSGRTRLWRRGGDIARSKPLTPALSPQPHPPRKLRQ